MSTVLVVTRSRHCNHSYLQSEFACIFTSGNHTATVIYYDRPLKIVVNFRLTKLMPTEVADRIEPCVSCLIEIYEAKSLKRPRTTPPPEAVSMQTPGKIREIERAWFIIAGHPGIVTRVDAHSNMESETRRLRLDDPAPGRVYYRDF